MAFEKCAPLLICVLSHLGDMAGFIKGFIRCLLGG